MQFFAARPKTLCIVLVLAWAANPRTSWARKIGIGVTECGGCHEGGNKATVTLTPTNTKPALGDTVRFNVSIEAPNVKGGGMYLEALSTELEPKPLGTLTLVAGQGLRTEGQGVTHTMPKLAVGGKVTFAVDWKAPASKAGAVINVSGIAANLSDTDVGDAFGKASATLAVGCDGGTDHWVDFDGDGFGSNDAAPVKACAPGPGLAAKKGDCNDTEKNVYPGVSESCNNVDDNCDGSTDEGFPQMALYTDVDGDGFGAGTEMKMGCGATFGWGIGNKDCNDSVKAINPGAMEMCNGKDDDCNGRIDNGVLPTCGKGLCLREAPSCDSANLCKPGAPKAEKCNLLDDDCDGEVDNGADICGAGQACVEGKCSDSGSGGAGGEGDSGGAGGGSNDNNNDGGGGCQIGTGGTPPAAVLFTLALGAFIIGRRRRR
ncbi:MAG: MopE-related protein [Deltaproteobacteria bacterium]|nr:MopE-related protein [Deltaproteobacteria bacterium]